jgi:hypothetical protein
MKDGKIKATMMDGGYYRADVTQNISVLVLDTMYYTKENNSTD